MNRILYSCESKTVATLFAEVVKKHPNKIAFLMDDTQMTFQAAHNFSNQVASYFKSLGYKKGDSIALVMENRMEYALIWLGLSKLGVITALVNTNLRKDVLVHSIKAANAKGVIIGFELADGKI